MAEHKMVTVDGIRYREEDAPKHSAVLEPEAPKSTRRPVTKKADNAKDSGEK